MHCFLETGTYNDMALRPFETHFTSQDVRMFNEATHGGVHISPEILASTAINFLKPTTTPRSFIVIDNGWNQPRFRFVMIVLVQGNFGQFATRKIIQGYTNHLGATASGAVDPNMILYFNNVITLKQTVSNDFTHGQGMYSKVVDANHILRGDFQPFSTERSLDANTITIRPEDVFSRHSIKALMDADLEVVDETSSFAELPVKKSRRTNNAAPHYMSNVIDAYKKTMDFGMNYESNMYDVGNSARGMVIDQSVSGDAFFNHLLENRSGFIDQGYIHYGTLLSLFPEADHVMDFHLAKAVSRDNVQSSLFTKSFYWFN